MEVILKPTLYFQQKTCITNSVLINIHLVSLFHTQDLHKCNFDVILEPLINVNLWKNWKMKVLCLSFSVEPVYGTISQVTGDNLGMHTILGFNESFSSHHFCRLCLIEKSGCQTYSEDDHKVILWGKGVFEVHHQSLQENPKLKSLYGLKKNLHLIHRSISMFVITIHLILCMISLRTWLSTRSNCFLDISHKTPVRTGLAFKDYGFDYGFLEQKKKRPTKIILESASNSIGLNSILTMCQKHPTVTSFLKETTGICYFCYFKLWTFFSPSLTQGMTIYLKHLIFEHHKLYFHRETWYLNIILWYITHLL